MPKMYCVYILASKRNGTLYIGVTSDLERRVCQHRCNQIEGFTSKYNVHSLVYYEQTENVYSAIQREKQLKKWNRQWKLELIEKVNPNWKDLTDDWIPSQAGNDTIKADAKAGGDIAGGARKQLEKRLGRSVVSRRNFLRGRQAALKK